MLAVVQEQFHLFFAIVGIGTLVALITLLAVHGTPEIHEETVQVTRRTARQSFTAIEYKRGPIVPFVPKETACSKLIFQYYFRAQTSGTPLCQKFLIAKDHLLFLYLIQAQIHNKKLKWSLAIQNFCPSRTTFSMLNQFATTMTRRKTQVFSEKSKLLVF